MRTLLISPPTWNVFAPHLAVPLLAAVLRRRGWTCSVRDMSIEQTDWLLSREGMVALGGRLESRLSDRLGNERVRLERAMLAHGSVIDEIDDARDFLSSPESLQDHDGFRRHSRTVRNALECVSMSFDDLNFDLFENKGRYSPRRSSDVLAASADPEHNVYAWALERGPGLPELDDPDLGLVGLSLSADSQLVAAMTITRQIKRRRPDVHVTWGGNFTTRMVTRWSGPHPFLDHVDSFVLYEGEDSLPALCETVAGTGTPLVPGLVDLDQRGQLRRLPSAAVDLAELPVPDFTDLPLDRYLAPGPILPLQASRSCAWNCAFCSIPFASNDFRIRAADRVADDMDELSARHGSTTFMFVDEIMTQTTLKRLTAELIERDAGYHWYGETRFSKGIDDALARSLRSSGCRRLDLGLESYNQRVIDLMRKGTHTEDVEPVVRALLDADVPFHLFCMTGFPGETADEAANTRRFVDDSLRRAREEYDNPYCTAANGPFVLDALSPVGQRPSDYGIQVIPPLPGEDLAFTMDYRTSSGLSRAQALELAVDVDKPADGPDGFNPHRGLWLGDVEEWVFLHAVAGQGRPARSAAPFSGPFTVAASSSVRLAPGAVRRLVGPDMEARWELYSPVTDAHLVLSSADLDIWSGLADGVDVWDLPEQAFPDLARSVALGLALVSPGPSSRSPSDSVESFVAQHTECVARPRATEPGHVVMTATGARLAVSAGALLLLHHCQPGATMADLVGRTTLPARRVEQILSALQEQGCLVAARVELSLRAVGVAARAVG